MYFQQGNMHLRHLNKAISVFDLILRMRNKLSDNL